MFFVRQLRLAHFLIETKGVTSMKIGIKKKMYKDGRIMIPKELRELYHFEENCTLSLIATPEGILITNPNYKVVKTKK